MDCSDGGPLCGIDTHQLVDNSRLHLPECSEETLPQIIRGHLREQRLDPATMVRMQFAQAQLVTAKANRFGVSSVLHAHIDIQADALESTSPELILHAFRVIAAWSS